MSLIDLISRDLNIPVDLVKEGLDNSRKLVKRIKIPKKNDSYRVVYQPSKKIKVIQNWININILKHLKVHKAATAYIKRKSIKDNAIKHVRNRYFLKLDFKDFFPSIRYRDFEPLIKEWFQENKNIINYEFSELSEIVRKTCFYLNNELPIGYPTSPIISNTAMYDFDSKISLSIENDKKKYGNAIYTRYADDLTFSTNQKGLCKNIKSLVKRTIREISSPKLKINEQKTRFVSKSGGSSLITGIRICYDNHLTIHKRYKDKVRLFLSLYNKNKLNDEDLEKLKGHLS